VALQDYEADDQRYQNELSETYRKAQLNAGDGFEPYGVQYCGDDAIAVAPASRATQAAELLSEMLKDANRTIANLMEENAKLTEDLRKLCHAAAHPLVIEEEPVEFPAQALRFSV
jgi:hypothetical protein